MQIFILAAGKQQRFPKNYTPKQLLIINNETLLQRQFRQLNKYNIIPTVITQNEQIKNHSPKWFHPKNNQTILETIKSTKELWEDRNIFLLGDTFYSQNLFKNIIENKNEIKFFMSGSEIFFLLF